MVAVKPGGRQQTQLVMLAGELEQRLLGAEETPRMRVEGKRRRLAAERPGTRAGGVDHRAVAAMDAVEITDRDDGASQGPRVDLRAGATDHMEESTRGKLRHENRFVAVGGF